MKYIMMRFYGGGGLARYEIVECEEENLIDHLAEFEEDCIRSNEGEYLGVISIEEFNRFSRMIKDMQDE